MGRSPFDPIVLLACVAINGYHGMSSYTWQRDQDVLTSHQTPLFYCVVVGTYTCSVIYDGFVMKCTFKVEGEFNISLEITHSLCTLYRIGKWTGLQGVT